MNFSIVQNYPQLSRLQLLLEFENERNNELDCTTELWLPACNSFEIEVSHTRTIRDPRTKTDWTRFEEMRTLGQEQERFFEKSRTDSDQDQVHF